MPKPRLAVPAALAPRNALWCHAHTRAAFDHSAATVLASVDGLAVRVVDRWLADGRPRADVAGWRWTSADADAVGELVVTAQDFGLALVGWWSPADSRPGAWHAVSLEMDVAGLTMWSGHRRVSTEDPCRIRALLAG